MILRSEIETIVNAIIDERLEDIAQSLDNQAYYDRDHAGSMERATAAVYDRIAAVLRGNIEESARFNTCSMAAELERLHKQHKGE